MTNNPELDAALLRLADIRRRLANLWKNPPKPQFPHVDPHDTRRKLHD